MFLIEQSDQWVESLIKLPVHMTRSFHIADKSEQDGGRWYDVQLVENNGFAHIW